MFCLAAAECAAAGLPIVASDIGALSERVIDNETGYLIRGDISQLSVQQQFVDSIVSLLNYPERIEQMSHAARLHATHSSPPEVAARWSELLI
jgi:glycosyltransferase involved in cell wall biosynthesis